MVRYWTKGNRHIYCRAQVRIESGRVCHTDQSGIFWISGHSFLFLMHSLCVIDDDCWGFNQSFSNFSAISAQPLTSIHCSVNDQIYGGENDRARPTAAVKGN